jgi:hypothetical protein
MMDGKLGFQTFGSVEPMHRFEDSEARSSVNSTSLASSAWSLKALVELTERLRYHASASLRYSSKLQKFYRQQGQGVSLVPSSTLTNTEPNSIDGRPVDTLGWMTIRPHQLVRMPRKMAHPSHGLSGVLAAVVE